MRNEARIPTAMDVMRRDPIALSPKQSVEDAVKTLLRNRISGAPVLDSGRVVGMFSERNALLAMASARYESEPAGPVEMHMQREFPSVHESTDIFALAQAFAESPVRRIAVVAQDGTLLGLVLRGDVMRALAARSLDLPTRASAPSTALERARQQLEGS